MAEIGSPEFERLIAEGQAAARAAASSRPEEGSAEAQEQRRESIAQGKLDGSGQRIERGDSATIEEVAEVAGPIAAREAYEDGRFRKHSVNAGDQAEPEESDSEREARVEAAKKAAAAGRPAADAALIEARRRGAKKPGHRQLPLF